MDVRFGVPLFLPYFGLQNVWGCVCFSSFVCLHSMYFIYDQYFSSIIIVLSCFVLLFCFFFFLGGGGALGG